MEADAGSPLAAILEGCRQGGDADWERLFALCIPVARRLALRMGFSRADADDICQETMMALSSNIHEIKDPFAFARTIASRRCIDRIRRKRPETPYAEAADAGDEGIDPAILEMCREKWIEQDQEAGSAEARLLVLDRLRDGLLVLGDPCRQLLGRKFGEDKSYQDIALVEGIPAPQVGVYIGRCIKRLKAVLQKNGKDWSLMARLWQEIR